MAREGGELCRPPGVCIVLYSHNYSENFFEDENCLSF
jgi:hypothetical protein